MLILQPGLLTISAFLYKYHGGKYMNLEVNRKVLLMVLS